MGWTRHTGTVVSLAVLASVVANIAVHRHFEDRAQRLTTAAEPYPGALIFDALSAMPDDGKASPIPRSLEDLELTQPKGLLTLALQSVETDDANGQSIPKPVPLPQEAAPIEENEPSDEPHGKGSFEHQAVRSVIEDELSESSREERDIWFDELKTLPAGVVRDLLQVRKQLRSLPRALHKQDAPAVAAPRIAELPAEPASQTRRQMQPDWIPTISALEQASTLARHNIANSTTWGYKRLRINLVDAYEEGWHDAAERRSDVAEPTPLNLLPVQGCHLGEILLDMSEGVEESTGNDLDLAIQGDGFFIATRNDKPVYTRCGSLTLDGQRRLCLALPEGSLLLDPVVTIPANCIEVQISASGTVSAFRNADVAAEAIGQIKIARFPNSSRLRPVGSTLLIPTAGSGSAEIGDPEKDGRGLIVQGFLELSNVDSEKELRDIEQWRQLLQSFPSTSRPLTASGKEPHSR
jgi:flagellar basal-body rod protein FlgG